jgi:hypothetical protein
MSLGALVDGPGVAVRAMVTSSGDALVSIVSASPQVTFGMGSEILESVQLVPGAHPEPYRRVPVRYDDATVSPRADAAVVTALVHQVLPEAQPAELSALAAAESRLGAALPDDVRALYLAADSGVLALLPQNSELFYGMRIMSLNDTAARAYLEPQARYLSWADGATEVVAPDPHGRVQPLAVSPAPSHRQLGRGPAEEAEPERRHASTAMPISSSQSSGNSTRPPRSPKAEIIAPCNSGCSRG